MTDKKQSAFARRLAQDNSANDSTNFVDLDTRVTNLSDTTNNKLIQTTQALETVKDNLSDTTNILGFHLSLDDPNSLNYRLTELENAPPSGGGGIDPTDPEPIIISENYVPQMQDWSYSGGSIQILSTNAYGTVTSPRIFQTSGLVSGFSGNNMFIVSANSETDHFGVIEIVVEHDVTGVLSLSQSSAQTICVPSDITRMIAIVKTPASFPSSSSFVIGFATDLSAPTEGIYFVANPATNTWTPTVNNGTSTSTGATTALATNTWYTLEISKVSASSFDFTINGTTVNLSTNVPTDPLTCGLWLDNASGPSPSQLKLKLDFFSLKLRDTTGGTLPTGVTVAGTANEVEVNLASSVYTIGLPNSIIVPTINTSQLNFNITPASPTNTIGGQYWDTSYSTLSLGLTTNTNLKIGQGLYKYVKNTTGTLIPKGKVVYVNGHSASTQLTIGLANASSEATSADVIGVTAEDIANTASGFVQTFGYLTGFATNTAEIPSGQEGKALYLSATTSGDMRIGLPTQPLHGVRVGFLVQRAGPGNGAMFINIQNYQEIEELSDVEITSIADLDILQWDNADLRWENRSLATAGIAAASHTHTLSNLTQSGASLNNIPQWNGTNWVPVSVSATPGGSTGQIQYNNASAFAGAANVKINSNNLELVKPATEPTTAPTDSVVMYTKSIGHRDLPAFVDASGWSTNLQTCIARNKFSLMAFNGGTNASPTSVGMVYSATTVGTGNTTGGTVAIGTTSLLAGSRRQSFLTANTAGNAAGWKTTSTQCWRGNATKRGGFFCVWKFGIGDATFQPNATLFVGLNDSTAVPDATAITNPFTTVNATMRNTVGLALYNGSSTYQIIHRNGTAAATAISTGFTANINDIVEFCLYCTPNNSTIHYYVKIYSSAGSDTEISGDIGTSNIPANTTLFVPHCWRGRTSTATIAVQVDCLSFSIEQPH